jgi:hypothetical protein
MKFLLSDGHITSIGLAIVPSMLLLSVIFMILCGLFEWKRTYAGILSLVYICIALGDPVIQKGDNIL